MVSITLGVLVAHALILVSRQDGVAAASPQLLCDELRAWRSAAGSAPELACDARGIASLIWGDVGADEVDPAVVAAGLRLAAKGCREGRLAFAPDATAQVAQLYDEMCSDLAGSKLGPIALSDADRRNILEDAVAARLKTSAVRGLPPELDLSFRWPVSEECARLIRARWREWIRSRSSNPDGFFAANPKFDGARLPEAWRSLLKSALQEKIIEPVQGELWRRVMTESEAIGQEWRRSSEEQVCDIGTAIERTINNAQLDENKADLLRGAVRSIPGLGPAAGWPVSEDACRRVQELLNTYVPLYRDANENAADDYLLQLKWMLWGIVRAETQPQAEDARERKARHLVAMEAFIVEIPALLEARIGDRLSPPVEAMLAEESARSIERIRSAASDPTVVPMFWPASDEQFQKAISNAQQVRAQALDRYSRWYENEVRTWASAVGSADGPGATDYFQDGLKQRAGSYARVVVSIPVGELLVQYCKRARSKIFDDPDLFPFPEREGAGLAVSYSSLEGLSVGVHMKASVRTEPAARSVKEKAESEADPRGILPR